MQGPFFIILSSFPRVPNIKGVPKGKAKQKEKKNKNKKSGEKYHPNTGAAGLGKDIGRIGTKNGESGREKSSKEKVVPLPTTQGII